MPANRASIRLTETYHDRMVSLAARVSGLVAARVDALDRSDLQGGFARIVTDGAAIIRLGETQARALTAAYFRVMRRLETGEATEPSMDDSEERWPLEKALAATPAKVFLALKMGRSLDQALAFARFSLGRLGHTATMNAARRQMAHLSETTPGTRGTQRRSRGTCGACLAEDDGSYLPPGTPLNIHPGCLCVAAPVFSVPTRVPFLTGIERFERMSKVEQDDILGPDTAELVRTGEVPWSSLVHRERYRRWRPAGAAFGITQTPLEDLEEVADGLQQPAVV